MNVWADICECLERKKISKYVQYVHLYSPTLYTVQYLIPSDQNNTGDWLS